MSIHFKTAIGSITRSPFQAIAAIFVLTLTFFVGTVLAILIYSSSAVLAYFETRPQIIAFLKDEAATEEIEKLQQRLAGDSRIKEVKYVTKEEALGIYKEATSDNPLLGELVSPAIFPASLEFSVRDLASAQPVIEEVKDEAVVDSVGFTASLGGEKSLSDVVSRLRSVTWYLRLGGGVFVTTLLGTSFLVLLIIIGMRMTSRREEVEILNLIGATPGFIRSPIVLEAVIYSVVGVFLGWVFVLILTLYSAPSIISYFGQIPVLPKDTLTLFELFGLIFVVEMVIGILIALTGSLLAVSRVRTKR